MPWHVLEGLAPRLTAAVDEVLAGAEAERVLDRLLRRERLSAEGRRVAAESVFGVGLWRRRLGAPAPALTLLCRLARDLGGFADAPRLLGVDASPAPEPTTLADRYSLPDWLAAELERACGAEAPAAADALNLPGPVFLRARGGRDELAKVLRADGIETQPCVRAQRGLRVMTERANLYGSRAWHEALFEVQDEGSQWIGELAAGRPGMRVLDLCAGAGGKTLQLAAEMEDRGELHVTDVDAGRLERLRIRAERARLSCVRIHRRDALPPGPYDVVLVDAPCSELGALRRGPDLRWRLDPRGFGPLPGLQRSLCLEAADLVAPGGRLVYATCTFRREENAEVTRAVEEARPALQREAELELWPHRDGTDGFYAMAWRRQP